MDLNRIFQISDAQIAEFKKGSETFSCQDLKTFVTDFISFKKGAQELAKNENVLRIGVVGQVKAGKSSFLNSLIFEGDSVLPKASTPMTAGLTILNYSTENYFEVEYYKQDEWDEFVRGYNRYVEKEKEIRNSPEYKGAPEHYINSVIESQIDELDRTSYELVNRCDASAKKKIGQSNEKVTFGNIKSLQTTLNKYVGVGGEFTSVVKSLIIHLNDERLKGMQIVDTPGVNDPIVSRENKTKEFLQSCHGVLFLSYSSRFLDAADVSFMNTRIYSQGVSTVLLLASKYDDVLQDQGMKYRDNLDDADTSSKNSLQKRFDTEKDKFGGDELNIYFDTTSGISYALAMKPKNSWDEMERHVDSRMHALFPSAFSDAEVSKDTYLELANLETIKERYVEGVFSQNKEEIIQKKMNDFISRNSNSLSQSIDKSSEYLRGREQTYSILEEEELLKQKKAQKQLFEPLKSHFSTAIRGFQTSLQTEVKNIFEKSEIKDVDRWIKKNEEIHSYERKGKFLLLFDSSETDYCTIKKVDPAILKTGSLAYLDRIRNYFASQWEEHFSKCREELKKRMFDLIKEVALKMSDFNDWFYRDLIERVVENNLKVLRVLELKAITEKYKKEISDICDDQRNVEIQKDFSRYSKEYAKEQVKKQAEEINKKLIAEVEKKIDYYFDTLKKKIDEEYIRKAIAELEEFKGTVTKQLETIGVEELEKLEKDIKSKKEKLKEISRLRDIINEVSGLIS